MSLNYWTAKMSTRTSAGRPCKYATFARRLRQWQASGCRSSDTRPNRYEASLSFSYACSSNPTGRHDAVKRCDPYNMHELHELPRVPFWRLFCAAWNFLVASAVVMVTRLMTGRRLSTSSEEMGGLLRLSNVYSLRRSCGTNLRFFTNSRKMAQFPQMLQSTNQNQVFIL